MSPLWKRSSTTPEPTPRVVPPVDLNQPVENPELVAAITAFANDPNPTTELAMQRAFNRAVFLGAADFTGATVTPAASGEAGQSVIQPGSRIGLRSAERDGLSFLAVFTDWPAIRKFTDAHVDGLVLPSADVITMGLSDYDGVVLNPAGPYLELTHDELGAIRAAGAG
jgi:hypothetical protein